MSRLNGGRSRRFDGFFMRRNGRHGDGDHGGIEPEDPSERDDDHDNDNDTGHPHDTSLDVDSFMDGGVSAGIDADGLHARAPSRRGSSSVDKTRSRASS